MGRLVELAEGWCRKGFMIPQVWESIKNLVTFDLPAVQDGTPGRPIAEVVELPSNDSKCLIMFLFCFINVDSTSYNLPYIE